MPALRALGEGGRYLVIGFASGTIPSLPLNQVLLRNRSVVGVDWGAWAMAHEPTSRRPWSTSCCWVADERLHPTAPGAPIPSTRSASPSTTCLAAGWWARSCWFPDPAVSSS